MIGDKKASCTAKIDSKVSPQNPSTPDYNPGTGNGGGSSGGCGTEWCVIDATGKTTNYSTRAEAEKAAQNVAYKGTATIKFNDNKYSEVKLESSSPSHSTYVEDKVPVNGNTTTIKTTNSSKGTTKTTKVDQGNGYTTTTVKHTDTNGKTTSHTAVSSKSGMRYDLNSKD